MNKINNNDDSTRLVENTENELNQYKSNSLTQVVGDTEIPSVDNSNSMTEKRGFRRVSKGIGPGLLIGAVSTVFTGMKENEQVSSANVDTSAGQEDESVEQPELGENQLNAATTAADSMSFQEAFMAARNEVGVGGTFEWRGHLYGTYTAEEWDNLSYEQKSEFSNRFNWNNIDSSESDVLQYLESNSLASTDVDDVSDDEDLDVEIVSVHHESQDMPTDNLLELENQMLDSDADVEVVSAIPDEATVNDVTQVNVAGQQIILMDVDGDKEYDYMAADSNGSGKFEQDEILDIRNEHIRAENLNDLPDTNIDVNVTGEMPDYSMEAGI
ncbi:MAG: hypothetical protein HDR88_00265 [Bacteroides sp.]|nr:hypothetical protein [Bacteroides sp.]